MVEGYLKQNPNATLREVGYFLGFSRQRASILLEMTGIKARRQKSTQLLTDRGLEIVGYIGKCSSNRQIAEDRGSSYQTIKNQVAVMIANLGANDREYAVALASEKGFISPDNLG